MHKEGLLLDIARCPIVRRCLANLQIDHPCADIVRVQVSEAYANHQVPEPWSGHLTQAPILFISSNPSLTDKDVFAKGVWPDYHITDYFENRFGGNRNQWIKDGTKGLRLCQSKEVSSALCVKGSGRSPQDPAFWRRFGL